MTLRQVGAVLMALLTACGGTSPALRPSADPYEAELAAARYELRVLSPLPRGEPVEVAAENFREAVAALARHVRPAARPAEAAWSLFGLEREVEFLAQVEGGRVVRLVPLGEGHTLSSRAEEELTREYQRWCERTRGGDDCLGLLSDGPTVHGEDKPTLALAIALGGTLDETKHALRGRRTPGRC